MVSGTVREMKNHSKKIITRSSFLLFIVWILSSTSFAFNLDLLKNDKEAESHTYSSHELKKSQQRLTQLGGAEVVSKNAYLALGQAMNELEEKNILCDLNLVRLFQTKLEANQVPGDLNTIKNILIFWRSQNLIDDLFF